LFSQRSPTPPIDIADRTSLTGFIAQGGFPEVCLGRTAARRDDWFRSYVTTILQRDVRELSNIEGLTELPRLLTLLASRVGSPINFADVARALSTPQTTLKRYIALLEMTFLVRLLPAWSGNLGKRWVKSPKLFLNDTGLLAHLLGLGEDRLGHDLKAFGPLIENFVYMELQKQASWSKTRPTLFHWRTHAGREVDIVMEDRTGSLVGIEVKSGATLGANDIQGLKAMAETVGDRFHRGIVLYTGRETLPFGSRIHAVPISALWQGVVTEG
jgi:predicted AAA+ superfamily ATPase